MDSSLHSGWRQCITTDRRIYYQNDITKQTQWQSPITIGPSTQRTSHINLEKCDDNAENDEIRKLWHKEHIIWLFTFVIGIYDYATDIQVAISWLSLPSLCKQFHCYTANQYETNEEAIELLIFSSIGFISGIVIKMIEFKSLYLIYTHPITEADAKNKEYKNWSIILKWGWIPIIVEDAVSLILIIWIYFLSAVRNIVGLRGIYLQSVAIATTSITVNLLNTFRKHRKLKKLNLFSTARKCHYCWCSCMCCCCIPIFVLILLLLLIIPAVAYVDISNDYNYDANNLNHIGFNISRLCPTYITAKAVDGTVPEDRVFFGNIMEPPNNLYDNCSGNLYEYDVICSQDKLKSNMILHCELIWEYMYKVENVTVASNMSEFEHFDLYSDFDCYNYDEERCRFDIEIGICQNYSVQCNNDVEFVNGNPIMWVCFDYCSA